MERFFEQFWSQCLGPLGEQCSGRLVGLLLISGCLPLGLGVNLAFAPAFAPAFAASVSSQALPQQTLNQASGEPQWQLTGQSADGLSQQYVDLNSLRPGDAAHQWLVDSYFTERKANEQVRADYVTLYDCDRQRYKDVNPDGVPAPDWGSAGADPLNRATMVFVCDRVGNAA
jgi:hypothetical protein